MAKDAGGKKSDVLESAEPAKDIVEKVTTPLKKSTPAPVVLFSFDRWFSTTGRPLHHKGGMVAFANTTGKKSLEEWQKIFKTY